MSINSKMDKSAVIYSYNEIQYSKENGKNTVTNYQMNDSSKHKAKKSDTEEYDSVYIKYKNSQN